MIRWLHISDLHFKTASDPDQQNMRHTLLRACMNGEVKADFVIATGDFHNIEDIEKYGPAKDFLVQLSFALGIDIKSDLFLVPGNHDLVPSAERNLRIAEIIGSEASDGLNDYTIPLTEKKGIIHTLLSAFDAYIIFAQNLVTEYDPCYERALDPVSVHIRVWNGRINLLHLNTAIISNGDRKHFEAVDIVKACSEEARETLNNGLPTLVLGHHSFYDLHSSIRDRLIQLFNQSNVWAYLAGDKHKINLHNDDYLIDKKTDTSAWPNIIAGKAVAKVDDTYSDFYVISYCWDEQRNLVTPKYLSWERKGSGRELTLLMGDYLRPFPMYSDVNSHLFNYLMDCLLETRKEHPSFQLMKIDETLFPDGIVYSDLCNYYWLDDEQEITQTLRDLFKESWQHNTQSHIMLEGEGGIGKTVALLSLPTELILLPHKVPAIYVPLYALKISDGGNSISNYIFEVILRFEKLLYDDLECLANKPWNKGPRLILLLDGFNEIKISARYAIARDIEEWSRKRGVQIITASRFDIRAMLQGITGEYKSIKLQPLSREIITLFLKSNHIELPKQDSVLWGIINIPLMLALYIKTEVVQKQKSDIPLDWHTASNAGSIIWNFLQQELLRCARQSKDIATLPVVALAIEYITPYIAWQMVRKNQYDLSEDEFCQDIHQALAQLKTWDKDALPKHFLQVLRYSGGMQMWPDSDNLFLLLTRSINVFRMQDSNAGIILRLMHQHFRDFFAALYLVNLAQLVKLGGILPEAWKSTVDSYVMNFVADIIKQSDADLLWEINRLDGSRNSITTVTMLELQRRIRQYDFTSLVFSGIDLTKIPLHRFRTPGRSLMLLPKGEAYYENCKIGERTFFEEGHSAEVTVVRITPDCKKCISASNDRTLRVWDLVTGVSQYTLKGHQGAINAISISTDSQICVSASTDHSIRVWDLESGKCLHTLEGHISEVQEASIFLNNTRCVSASRDGAIKIWDIISGEFLLDLCGHRREVYSVVVSLDNRLCVSGSADGTLRVWDLCSGECIHILEGHTEPIYSLSLTPDGKQCISASQDKTLRVWNILSGKCEFVLTGHEEAVCAVATSPNNWQCVSASEDDTLRVWNITNGKNIYTFKGHEGSVKAISITMDGKKCVSASCDNTLRIWDMRTGECIYILKGHEGEIGSISIRCDGMQCVSASSDRTLRVWDINYGKCLHVFRRSILTASKAIITRDGKYCINAYNDNTLRIWDLLSETCVYLLEGHTNVINSIDMTEDNKHCVSASDDGTIRVWDLSTGKCKHTLCGQCASIESVSVTPDERRCVSGGWDGTIRVWDLATGECIHTMEGHQKFILSITITPDGRKCISASADTTLRIWDLEAGTCLHVLEGHKDFVLSADVTSDGMRCVSASDDSTLRVWDILTGECLHILTGHSWSVSGVRISHDDRTCVSMSNDCTLSVWDLKTGKRLHSLIGHRKPICAVNISLDSKICISASWDNTLRIWDMQSGSCRHSISDQIDTPIALGTAPENRCFTCSSSDGSVQIWNMIEGKCMKVMRPIPGFTLRGINLTKAIVIPADYKDVLRNNGAIVS